MSKESYRKLRSEGEVMEQSLPEMKCPYCRKGISSKNGMSRHWQLVHPDLFQGKQLLQKVMQGTEMEEPLRQGVICAVCWLRVHKRKYAQHIAAHLEVAELEVGFLPRLLGQMPRT